MAILTTLALFTFLFFGYFDYFGYLQHIGYFEQLVYLYTVVQISVSLSLFHVTFSTVVMKACMCPIPMFVESNLYSTWESNLMGLLECNGDE